MLLKLSNLQKTKHNLTKEYPTFGEKTQMDAPSKIFYRNDFEGTRGVELKLISKTDKKAIYQDFHGNEHILVKSIINRTLEKHIHLNHKYFLDIHTLRLSSMEYIKWNFLDKYTRLEAAIQKCRFREAPQSLEIHVKRKESYRNR